MKTLVLVIVVLITQCLKAQTIKGIFPQAKNTEIVVKGFAGIDEIELSKTTTDSLGNFTLSYPTAYHGASLFEIKNATSVIVLLNDEKVEFIFQIIKNQSEY